MSTDAAPSSPLDPFMAPFLVYIQGMESGFLPGAETRVLAAELALPEAFVEALFTSARMRGLLKPAFGRGNRPRWIIAPSGSDLVSRQDPPAIAS